MSQKEQQKAVDELNQKRANARAGRRAARSRSSASSGTQMPRLMTRARACGPGLGRWQGVNTGPGPAIAIVNGRSATPLKHKPRKRRPLHEDFHRIKRLPPYVFAEVNRLKAAARARGADIIDLGMGNPDLPTPQHIVDKLVETVAKPRTHRYSASKGIPGLRRAQAAYYERRFGVKLDPETQIVATLGSKEGFANMAQAITAPGDVILVPNPTYPIHEFGFIMSGAAMRHLPAATGEDFLRAVERACKHTIPKPLALVLSYPSNPTAMTAELDFYKDAVAAGEEARSHHPVRHRLCGDLFRRQPAAVGAAGAGRHRHRGRVHLAVEDLQHAGLAHGLCGRQRAADRGAGARQVLPRLRRLHADPGGGRRRAQRPAGVRRGDPRHLQEPPRLLVESFGARRLGHPAAAGDDVRLGAGAGAVQGSWARSSSPSC